MKSEFLLLLEDKALEAEAKARRLPSVAGPAPKGAALVVRPQGYFWAVVLLWDVENESACRWAAHCWAIVKGESFECRKLCYENPLADFGNGVQRLRAARALLEADKGGSRRKRRRGVACPSARKNGRGV